MNTQMKKMERQAAMIIATPLAARELRGHRHTNTPTTEKVCI